MQFHLTFCLSFPKLFSKRIPVHRSLLSTYSNISSCFLLCVFSQFGEPDTQGLSTVSEKVTLCSCSCQRWASITSAGPVVRNCVGGVSTGSTGHSPGLSNEGNTTLPHTNILHSHLQSQAPLPMSITTSVIDVWCTWTPPGGLRAINTKNTRRPPKSSLG